MQNVMSQLQQLGASDPAAQEELMAELRQVDPELWPLALHTRRAMDAYRLRAEQRERDIEPGGPVAPAATASRVSPAPEYASQYTPEPATPHARRPPDTAAVPAPPAVKLHRLPTADDVAITPTSAPHGNYPQSQTLPKKPYLADRPPEPEQSADRSASVMATSSDPAATADWQSRLAFPIEALEQETQRLELRESELQRGPVIQPDQVREIEGLLTSRHAQLRMLYLLAGRRDDAVRPIPSISPTVSEFWSKQLYGLDTWLDSQRTPDAMHRAAKTTQELSQAIGLLGESASLVVSRLAFCSKIDSYGCYHEFNNDEFVPGQEVLLYAEVENFASVSTEKGFHTSLRSSYEIFNNLGQRVDDHDFTNTEEYCRNRRRDFFIGYHLNLPAHVLPGKYTLTLTVEDLQSRKVGQSSLEFTIDNGN